MSIKDRILSEKPESIFDVVDRSVFLENGDPCHEYISSRNCYEYYFAIGRHSQPRSILEIGVRFGYSFCAMAAGSQRLTYAEGWDNETYNKDSNQVAAANLRKISPQTEINIIRKSSRESSSLERSYDLIHVDGDHSFDGAMHDLKLAEGKCKVLVIDDYFFLADVRAACDEFLKGLGNIGERAFTLPSYRGQLVIVNGD